MPHRALLPALLLMLPVASSDVRYTIWHVHGARDLAQLVQQLGPSRLDQVARLNRVDRDRIRGGDSLVVPQSARWDSLAPDWTLFLPFPRALPAADSIPRLLVISARIQAWAAYDSGRIVRWGTASTGRRDKPTPAGLYHTNWKQTERHSTFNDEWLLRWYVNLDSRLGISLHQYELPGRPASHACVRLVEDDARWLYDWARTWRIDPDEPRRVVSHGTPVVVMDAYDFGGRPPWRALAQDPHANDISADAVVTALRRFGALAPDATTPAVASPADSARARAEAAARAARAASRAHTP